MKRIGILLLSSVAITNAFAIATAPGVNTNAQNFLGGVARGQFSALFNPQSAGSFLFEAGPRNYRANGTIGFDLTSRQRLKLTGEYLTQNIDYNFYSGVTRQWMQQSAVALGYEIAVGNAFQNYINLDGYYSYAPSKNLSTVSGSFINAAGSLINYMDQRRIAGSKAGGVNPGWTFYPWRGAETSLIVNYDRVTYDRVLLPQLQVNGFGGTVNFSQVINPFTLAASAATRAPFNTYHAELDWNTNWMNNGLLIGVFGNYTQGKYTLPSTSLVGLNVQLALNSKIQKTSKQHETFANWIAKPAVYMPQVLAVPDERNRKTTVCSLPILSGSIPNQIGVLGEAFTFFSGSFFSSEGDTTFSAENLPSGLSIDPETGTVIGTLGGSSTSVVITASNSCGRVSSNVFSITT